jgi:hypothetical protein
MRDTNKAALIVAAYLQESYPAALPAFLNEAGLNEA